jgi:hypothetical protein
MSQSRSVEEILQRLYAQIDDEGLRHDYDGAELSQHGRQLIAAALTAYGEQVREEEREKANERPIHWGTEGE